MLSCIGYDPTGVWSSFSLSVVSPTCNIVRDLFPNGGKETYVVRKKKEPSIRPDSFLFFFFPREKSALHGLFCAYTSLSNERRAWTESRLPIGSDRIGSFAPICGMPLESDHLLPSRDPRDWADANATRRSTSRYIRWKLCWVTDSRSIVSSTIIPTRVTTKGTNQRSVPRWQTVLRRLFGELKQAGSND